MTKLGRYDCSKKKKKIQQDGTDLISELPDSLLIYILLLLDDTKDAVKTDLLSKRWLNLWTNLDTLAFNCGIKNPSRTELKQFMLFVDKTLMQCACPKIKKFCLTGSRFYQRSIPFSRELLDKWVHFVLVKNVEVVKLGLKWSEYTLPVWFFCNSSFVSLEIDKRGRKRCPANGVTSLVSLSTEASKTFNVRWNMLKSLSLKHVYVKNEFLTKILLGCPVLETMILDHVQGLNVIDVTSPCLRELKVLNFESNDWTFTTLDIRAPWVEKLEILGCFDWIECKLARMSSLKSAALTLSYTIFLESESDTSDESSDSSEDDSDSSTDEDEVDPDSDSDEDEEHYGLPETVWCNMINALLKPVCKVDELVIGTELLQALSMSKLSNGDFPLFSCKYVKLESTICMHEVPGIVALLESSPYLETLVINMMPLQSHGTNYTNEKVFSSFSCVDYLWKEERLVTCVKNVTIDCTVKPCNCCDKLKNNKSKYFSFEREVVAYIIRNTPVLEKMIILSDCSVCATMYMQLMSSKDEVGDQAARWELKKRNSTYEFSFVC